MGERSYACDYFTVDTVFFKRLYVLVFLELASRRVVFTPCRQHPGGAWAAQQARNLAWDLQDAEVKPRFLIHDRDSNFPAALRRLLQGRGPGGDPDAGAGPERECSLRTLDLQCAARVFGPVADRGPAAAGGGLGRVRGSLQRLPAPPQPGAAAMALRARRRGFGRTPATHEVGLLSPEAATGTVPGIVRHPDQ
jgi:putative transposase